MFPAVECPGFVRRYADGFKDIVGQHYREWVSLLAGTVTGLGSLSDAARFLFFSRSVSSLSRFLSSGKAPEINRRHRRRVRTWALKAMRRPSDFLFVVDDTVLPRRGRKQWAVYTWYDHATKSFTDGHKLLVVGLMCRRRRLVIPIHWQMLHVQSQAPERYRCATDVALSLLDVLVAEGFPKLTVTADCWFSGEPFYAGLDERGFKFVVENRSDRVVHAVSGTRVAPKTKLPTVFESRVYRSIHYRKRRRFAAESVLTLRSCRTVQLKIVAVKNRVVDEMPYAFYATNWLAWNAQKVWSISRDRWMIEVLFRELKSLFALGEPAVRTENGIETTVSISMVALTVIRSQQWEIAAQKRLQDSRPVPALAIVQQSQTKLLHRGISALANPTTGARLYQRISHNLDPRFLRQKPTEKSFARRSLVA